MDGNEPTSLSSISPTETTTKTLNEIGNTASLSSWSNVERVVAAAFCYPIIATCSHNGAISIYMVQGKPSKGSQNWCRLLHTLYGTPPSSPIGISLEKISSSISTELKGIRWRILVSFGLELYDGSWTVRLQETEFSEHQILHSTEIGAEGGDTAETGEKFDGDEGYSSSPSGYSKYISPTSHGRVGPISGISISWPFVVTTHSENTLNVFQLDRRLERGNTQKSTIEGQQPKLLKRRLRFHHLSTLYGHCGAVSSVSIESRSGRLVSASMDRSIKIWTTTVMNHEDLLEQRRVHQCVVSISDIDKSWTESGQVTKEEGSGLIWVGSDDEKIVSMSFDGVVKVWQFS
ncbi:hypothetical protein BGZ76_006915 [Entomortierella beljakovae]|nr:hypothetical protein BGZ76_006915 [Entomortierella beljakovae]